METENRINKILRWAPTVIGYSAMYIMTWFWSFWSIGEMYHEGWWGAWYNRAFYLIPMILFVGLTLIVLYFPKTGAWITIGFGILLTGFFWGDEILSGDFSLQNLAGFLPIGGGLVLFGFLFFAESKRRKRRAETGWVPSSPRWWRRNWYTLLLVSVIIAIILSFSVYYVPKIIRQVDDGYRGEVKIEGNGITLIWAPKGPGWNWQQEWGGYPSWSAISLYGIEPIGLEGKTDEWGSMAEAEQYHLCLYLNEDGTQLKPERQDIWRMPTVDEIVRSLVVAGKNAGCAWNGEIEQMVCTTEPFKSGPLWALDEAPIYYWAYEESPEDEREAYFVSHNGWVNVTRKFGGNPRHSYRCVKDISP